MQLHRESDAAIELFEINAVFYYQKKRQLRFLIYNPKLSQNQKLWKIEKRN